MSSNRLITMNELLNYPGMSSVPEDKHPILEALIDTVTAQFEKEWGTFAIQRSTSERVTYRKILADSPGAGIIRLSKGPIVSVSSIVDPAGNSIDADDYWIDYEDSSLRTAGRFQRPVDANGHESYWTITYVGGQAVDTAAVPYNIKTAAKMWVSQLFTNPMQNITSKTLGDFSQSYRYDESAADQIPSQIKSMISDWKRDLL
jgi:hypothetical protein